MKKITHYFSLLLVLLMVTLPSYAGGIASVEELSSSAAYVVKSARGYMVYAPQYATEGAWCSQNTTNGAAPIEVNEADANSQWAFITSPKGFTYLWSVGAKKFLYAKNPGTILSDTPMGTDVNLLASTGGEKATYPWVIAFGQNQINMSTNQATSIFTNWNDTGDQGNMVEIKKVADLSADVLSAANAAITEYEKNIVVGISSLDQLNSAKSYYVMNPRGDWAYDPAFMLNGELVGDSSLVATSLTGVAADLAAANKQFAFVQAASGNRYLYSVGAQKFVGVHNFAGQDGVSFFDAPKEKLNFLKGERGAKYAWVLALNEKQIGVSTGYPAVGGIITSWNSLSDEGNCVMVVEGDDFNATLAVDNANAYEAGLVAALSEALKVAQDKLEKVNQGSVVATDEQKAALQSAVDAALAADLVKDNYQVLVDNLNAAVEAIPEAVAPTTLVSVTPDPANGALTEVPAELVFQFSNEIKSVTELMVKMGMFSVLPEESVVCTVEGNVVKLGLPVAQMNNPKQFMLAFVATDVNGQTVTYGDFGEGYVGLTYKIQAKPNTFKCVEVSPAAGEVKSLKEIVLTFASDSNPFAQVGGFKPNTKIFLHDDGGVSVAKGTLEKMAGVKKNKAKIVFDKEITLAGIYSLTIPEGVIFDSQFDETEEDFGVDYFGATYNPEIQLEYTILGETAFEINPNPEVELKEIPEQIVVKVGKPVGGVDFAMVSSSVGQSMLDCSVSGDSIILNMPVDNLQGAASFSIQIFATDAEGNDLCYGDPEMIYLEYTVALPANRYGCREITPTEGEVESLKNFALTFYDANSPWGNYIGNVDANKQVVLTNEAGEIIANATVAVEEMSSVANVTLDKEITEPGTYVLVVPEGLVSDRHSQIYNPEMKFTFTISVPTGIENVLKGVENVKVYNLNGVLVGKSLKNLPKGVYVVNGHKVVVK